MKLAVAFGSGLLVFAASSHAQENLVGKYNGTFLLQTQSRGVLPIAIEGTYQDNKIEMESEPGGPAKECVMRLQLVAEGNKLKGKMGASEVEFSK